MQEQQFRQSFSKKDKILGGLAKKLSYHNLMAEKHPYLEELRHAMNSKL